MLLYYAGQSDDRIQNLIITSPCVIEKYTKLANFKWLGKFHILRYFATKLHNSAKSMMLFSAVAMNSPNSKVRLKEERSILYYDIDFWSLFDFG